LGRARIKVSSNGSRNSAELSPGRSMASRICWWRIFAVVARHIQPDRSYLDTSPPDSFTKLIKVRISPQTVKEVACLGQRVDEKPRTEESGLFDPAVVSPVQEGRQ
jgi:hypothetical protein